MGSTAQRGYRSGRAAGAQLIPVLKDNAYGLGLEAMGRVMEEFPQITTHGGGPGGEGAALRQAGITREILVLGGVPAHLLRGAVELDLTLSVGRLELLPGAGTAGTVGRPAGKNSNQDRDRAQPHRRNARGGAGPSAGGVAGRTRNRRSDYGCLQPLCRPGGQRADPAAVSAFPGRGGAAGSRRNGDPPAAHL